MKNKLDLTIAISTFNDRISQAIRLAATLDGICHVLIVHQVTKVFTAPQIPTTMRYLCLQGKGVAKSRNAALAASDTKYLWFLDDDVSVDVERAAACLSKLISTSPSYDVITVGVLDEYGYHRKNFAAKAFDHNLISILSVGTIEIIVKRDVIIAKNCFFPDDMGAGSDLPVADEPVFLAECLRAGLVVIFTPAYFVSHPVESSGGQFSNIRASRARGVAFRRIYGLIFGWFLLTTMYIKNLILRKIPINAMIKSYFSSLNGLLKNQ